MESATVVSLYSGCGGLDLGFKQQGFELLYACDSDPAATRCYEHNVDKNVSCRDVTSEEFHREINEIGACDVVLGGFPCQGFSKAGPKVSGDPRNQLYLEMHRAIDTLRPKFFLAENVDGLSQNFQGRFVSAITSDFQRLGYSVEVEILNAAAFGVPQHRRRILFVGTRLDQPFTWPTPTNDVADRNGEFKTRYQMELWHGPSPTKPPLTICDAIGDLVELSSDVPDHQIAYGWPSKYEAIFKAIGPGQKLCNVRHAESSVYTWQIPAAFGKTTSRQKKILETIGRHRRHKRYGDIPNGNPLPESEICRLAGLKNLDDDIDKLVAGNYLKEKDGGYDLKGAMFCSGLFKRPNFDEPSPTVLTNFNNPRYFLHPTEDRPFSLRECARLQGFPDSFTFVDAGVSLVDGYRLVGNAVPPPLARCLAEQISAALSCCLK